MYMEIEIWFWDFSSLMGYLLWHQSKASMCWLLQKHMEPNAASQTDVSLSSQKRYGLLFCITQRATSILFFSLFCFLLLAKTVLSVILKLFYLSFLFFPHSMLLIIPILCFEFWFDIQLSVFPCYIFLLFYVFFWLEG